MTAFSRRPIAALVCCLFAGVPFAHAADDGASLVLPSEPGGDALTQAPARLRVDRRLLGAEYKKAAPNTVADQEKVARTPETDQKRAVPNPVAEQKKAVRNPVAEQKKAVRNPVADKVVPLLSTDGPSPMFLTAEHIEGQTDELMVAEGNVELRKEGMSLESDRLTYRPLDDEADASGNVRLFQEGTEVHSTQLKMKLSEQIGFADQATYSVVKEVDSELYAKRQKAVSVASINGANSGAPMMLNVANMYGLPTELPPQRDSTASGQAERIDFEGKNHMRLTDSTFSTCKPVDPDWYLKAERIDLDFDENYGGADNASLWFKGVPLFYTPKAWFPLRNQRRSGVLNPSFKQSTKTGLDITVPYYWNIAPNYDLTLFPRYMSKRGVQLGAEARYLGAMHGGELRAEYMPDDTSEERSRYAYTFKHKHNFGSGLSGAVNWNGVSDDRYWEDMSSRLLQTSQVQLERRVSLDYVPSPWLQTSLQVLRHQTLQPDPGNPIQRPYFLEPQLNLLGYRPNLKGFDFSIIGQFSRFTHDDTLNKDRGDRLVIYPQLSLPIVTPAFQITPKLGLHMTSYAIDRAQLAGGDAERMSRVLPTFTLDSTMVFEREGSLLGNAYIQTLEPRLYYVNIPYKDQSRIPVFDTGLSDFNFAQVFSENRYSGYDRVNDANQLTAAVTTRVLDGTTGAERFKAMLGQRYYFSQRRVSIPGEVTREKDFSNLIAAVTGLVAPKTYAEATWEYSYDERVSDRFSAGVRFQPDYGKVLSASYRYTRDPLTNKSLVDQVDFAGQWPIAPQWYAVGRYNYSLRDNQMLETIGGVEYNAGCWSVRAVAQRLTAVSGSPNTSFFLQLELQDFASIGSNPLGLLRRSIPGYGKTNELPTDRSLISNY
jgi:LPS-assembly protein